MGTVVEPWSHLPIDRQQEIERNYAHILSMKAGRAACARKYNAEILSDPVRRAARYKRVNEWRSRRYRSDPEWRAKVIKDSADWGSQNPDYQKEYNPKYQRDRRAADDDFRLRGNLRSRIRTALIKHGVAKNFRRTEELIGCSVAALRAHLEAKFTAGMSWSNYGKWHVDHVKPCASFNLTDLNQQRICFHWTNLQPLWGPDNIRKGAKVLA